MPSIPIRKIHTFMLCVSFSHVEINSNYLDKAYIVYNVDLRPRR